MDVSVGDTIPVILKDSDPRQSTPGIKKRRSPDRRNRKKRAREGVVVHLSGKAGERRSPGHEKRRLTY